MVAQEVEAGTPGCSSLARILTPESPLGEPQLGLLTIAVLTSEELPLLLIKRLGGSPMSSYPRVTISDRGWEARLFFGSCDLSSLT